MGFEWLSKRGKNKVWNVGGKFEQRQVNYGWENEK